MSFPQELFLPPPPYPTRATMRAYCFVLSQEVVAAFPLKVRWFVGHGSSVEVTVTLQMGQFRAIADGVRDPTPIELEAIARLMKHFTPAPHEVLSPEEYERFFGQRPHELCRAVVAYECPALLHGAPSNQPGWVAGLSDGELVLYATGQS